MHLVRRLRNSRKISNNISKKYKDFSVDSSMKRTLKKRKKIKIKSNKALKEISKQVKTDESIDSSPDKPPELVHYLKEGNSSPENPEAEYSEPPRLVPEVIPPCSPPELVPQVSPCHTPPKLTSEVTTPFISESFESEAVDPISSHTSALHNILKFDDDDDDDDEENLQKDGFRGFDNVIKVSKTARKGRLDISQNVTHSEENSQNFEIRNLFSKVNSAGHPLSQAELQKQVLQKLQEERRKQGKATNSLVCRKLQECKVRLPNIFNDWNFKTSPDIYSSQFIVKNEEKFTVNENKIDRSTNERKRNSVNESVYSKTDVNKLEKKCLPIGPDLSNINIANADSHLTLRLGKSSENHKNVIDDCKDDNSCCGDSENQNESYPSSLEDWVEEIEIDDDDDDGPGEEKVVNVKQEVIENIEDKENHSSITVSCEGMTELLKVEEGKTEEERDTEKEMVINIKEEKVEEEDITDKKEEFLVTIKEETIEEEDNNKQYEKDYSEEEEEELEVEEYKQESELMKETKEDTEEVSGIGEIKSTYQIQVDEKHNVSKEELELNKKEKEDNITDACIKTKGKGDNKIRVNEDCKTKQRVTPQKSKNNAGISDDLYEKSVIDDFVFLSFETQNDLDRYSDTETARHQITLRGKYNCNKKKLSNRSGLFSSGIVPTKTKDITKIKGWRRKTFAMNVYPTLNNDLPSMVEVNDDYESEVSISDCDSRSIGETERNIEQFILNSELINKENNDFSDSSSISKANIEETSSTTHISELESENSQSCPAKFSAVSVKENEGTSDSGTECKSAFVSEKLEDYFSNCKENIPLNGSLDISFDNIKNLMYKNIIKMNKEESFIRKRKMLNSEKDNSQKLKKSKLDDKKPSASLTDDVKNLEPQDESDNQKFTNKEISNKDGNKDKNRKTNISDNEIHEKKENQSDNICVKNLAVVDKVGGKVRYSKQVVPKEPMFKVYPNVRLKFMRMTGGNAQSCLKRAVCFDGSRKDLFKKLLYLNKFGITVSPSVGKTLPTAAAVQLQNLRKKSPIIDEHYADFATSLIRAKKYKKEKHTVVFPVEYEDLLVSQNITKSSIEEAKENIAKQRELLRQNDPISLEVRKIVNDMVNCIVNSELDPTVPKTDPDSIRNLNVSSGRKNIFKHRKKFGSLVRELQKLDVNVIEMDLNETEENANTVKADIDNSKCDKPHCRLGCICSSLQCSGIIRTHCGRERCMFQCRCNNKSSSVTVSSANSDNLNQRFHLLTGALTRLQNESNYTLAKQEKDFKQTVIKAKDETFVVGSRGGNRRRREIKLPGRFKDSVLGKEFAFTELKMMSSTSTDGIVEEDIKKSSTEAHQKKILLSSKISDKTEKLSVTEKSDNRLQDRTKSSKAIVSKNMSQQGTSSQIEHSARTCGIDESCCGKHIKSLERISAYLRKRKLKALQTQEDSKQLIKGSVSDEGCTKEDNTMQRLQDDKISQDDNSKDFQEDSNSNLSENNRQELHDDSSTESQNYSRQSSESIKQEPENQKQNSNKKLEDDSNKHVVEKRTLLSSLKDKAKAINSSSKLHPAERDKNISDPPFPCNIPSEFRRIFKFLRPAKLKECNTGKKKVYSFFIHWPTLRRLYEDGRIHLWLQRSKGVRVLVTEYNRNPHHPTCSSLRSYEISTFTGMPKIVTTLLTRDKAGLSKLNTGIMMDGIFKFDGRALELIGYVVKFGKELEVHVKESHEDLQKQNVTHSQSKLSSKGAENTLQIPLPLFSQPTCWYSLLLDDSFTTIWVKLKNSVRSCPFYFKTIMQTVSLALKKRTMVRTPFSKSYCQFQSVIDEEFALLAIPEMAKYIFIGPFDPAAKPSVTTENDGSVYESHTKEFKYLLEKYPQKNTINLNKRWLYAPANKESTKPEVLTYRNEVDYTVVKAESDVDEEENSSESNEAKKRKRSHSEDGSAKMEKIKHMENIGLNEKSSKETSKLQARRHTTDFTGENNELILKDAVTGSSGSHPEKINAEDKILKSPTARKNLQQVIPSTKDIKSSSKEDSAVLKNSPSEQPNLFNTYPVILIPSVEMIGYVKALFFVSGHVTFVHKGLPEQRKFLSVQSACVWLNSYLKSNLTFVPSTLMVTWKAVPTTNIPDSCKPFDPQIFQGKNVVTTKGVFEIRKDNISKMKKNLQFHVGALLSRRFKGLYAQLQVQPGEKLSRLDIITRANEEIGKLISEEASYKASKMQEMKRRRGLVVTICNLLKEIPESIRSEATQNFQQTLFNKSSLKDKVTDAEKKPSEDSNNPDGSAEGSNKSSSKKSAAKGDVIVVDSDTSEIEDYLSSSNEDSEVEFLSSTKIAESSSSGENNKNTDRAARKHSSSKRSKDRNVERRVSLLQGMKQITKPCDSKNVVDVVSLSDDESSSASNSKPEVVGNENDEISNKDTDKTETAENTGDKKINESINSERKNCVEDLQVNASDTKESLDNENKAVNTSVTITQPNICQAPSSISENNNTSPDNENTSTPSDDDNNKSINQLNDCPVQSSDNENSVNTSCTSINTRETQSAVAETTAVTNDVSNKLSLPKLPIKKFSDLTPAQKQVLLRMFSQKVLNAQRRLLDPEPKSVKKPGFVYEVPSAPISQGRLNLTVDEKEIIVKKTAVTAFSEDQTFESSELKNDVKEASVYQNVQIPSLSTTNSLGQNSSLEELQKSLTNFCANLNSDRPKELVSNILSKTSPSVTESDVHLTIKPNVCNGADSISSSKLEDKGLEQNSSLTCQNKISTTKTGESSNVNSATPLQVSKMPDSKSNSKSSKFPPTIRCLVNKCGTNIVFHATQSKNSANSSTSNVLKVSSNSKSDHIDESSVSALKSPPVSSKMVIHRPVSATSTATPKIPPDLSNINLPPNFTGVLRIVKASESGQSDTNKKSSGDTLKIQALPPTFNTSGITKLSDEANNLVSSSSIKKFPDNYRVVKESIDSSVNLSDKKIISPSISDSVEQTNKGNSVPADPPNVKLLASAADSAGCAKQKYKSVNLSNVKILATTTGMSAISEQIDNKILSSSADISNNQFVGSSIPKGTTKFGDNSSSNLCSREILAVTTNQSVGVEETDMVNSSSVDTANTKFLTTPADTTSCAKVEHNLSSNLSNVKILAPNADQSATEKQTNMVNSSSVGSFIAQILESSDSADKIKLDDNIADWSNIKIPVVTTKHAVEQKVDVNCSSVDVKLLASPADTESVKKPENKLIKLPNMKTLPRTSTDITHSSSADTDDSELLRLLTETENVAKLGGCLSTNVVGRETPPATTNQSTAVKRRDSVKNSSSADMTNVKLPGLLSDTAVNAKQENKSFMNIPNRKTVLPTSVQGNNSSINFSNVKILATTIGSSPTSEQTNKVNSFTLDTTTATKPAPRADMINISKQGSNSTVNMRIVNPNISVLSSTNPTDKSSSSSTSIPNIKLIGSPPNFSGIMRIIRPPNSSDTGKPSTSQQNFINLKIVTPTSKQSVSPPKQQKVASVPLNLLKQSPVLIDTLNIFNANNPSNMVKLIKPKLCLPTDGTSLLSSLTSEGIPLVLPKNSEECDKSTLEIVTPKDLAETTNLVSSSSGKKTEKIDDRQLCRDKPCTNVMSGDKQCVKSFSNDNLCLKPSSSHKKCPKSSHGEELCPEVDKNNTRQGKTEQVIGAV